MGDARNQAVSLGVNARSNSRLAQTHHLTGRKAPHWVGNRGLLKAKRRLAWLALAVPQAVLQARHGPWAMGHGLWALDWGFALW
ncbi:hypothetical protein DI396_03485 [Litorivita pollutaquae]|uniref:Uncharacterized protein n=1 Tax=Litorivita pollutaquae TaxID=2200892 RepID=A0A2V4NFD3_9RHOB|nr:hypothetical protein DI396_03485 [Litorivita pollutaquae]